jgi:hypothetical protein
MGMGMGGPGAIAGGIPPQRVDLGLLPPGQEPGMGVKSMDAISKTLAAVSPGQMQDVMSGMKVGLYSCCDITQLLHFPCLTVGCKS